ncbi:MAG: fibronectin type III domain-containing protein [Deltaproteobacteria bacterium]|nr:fibronectin type III domain-containing protein [Deltaproteobacteria bacterium]MDA8307813.1 fibronectin type III domain-containing protein [Deltaproteobacteria bacterium]
MRILPDFAKHGWLGIIFLCALSAVISGCGHQTFPEPIGAPPPPGINDLSARIEPRAVALSWSPLPRAEAKTIRYAIMKSNISWKKRNCLQCPPPAELQVQSIAAATAEPGPDGKLHWTDHDVSYHQAYRYQIALINNRGVTLSHSNPVIAKIYPGPVGPEDLTAITQQLGILLRWKQTPRDTQGHPIDASTISFRVQRLTAAGAWKDVSPLVRGDAYYDQQLSPGQSFTYRVVAVRYIDGENVYGEPSSRITVMGPQSMPPPPPGSVWTVPTHGGLKVYWRQDQVKTSGYYVYRKQGKEIVRLTASPVLHPPFIDRGVTRGENYYYAVSAVSALPSHKEGLLSKWVEVTNR